MGKPLDLELLKTLVAVVEAGSLSRAAPRIGRSQSAISMQLQRLEQIVGKQLLIRGPRAATPTVHGADFLIYARQLLKLSDEAWASITRPQETGVVRLGVPDIYAAYLLPPVLARFAEVQPLVTVELVCEPSSALVKAIEDESIDVALVTRLPSQPLEVLRRERFVWVASSNHVAWKSDPLPVALFEPGCTPRMNVLHALGQAGRSYRAAYSSASLLGLIAVVQAGLAVAALNEWSVPPSLSIIGEAEGLPPLQDLEISLLQLRDVKSASVQRLIEFLTRELAQNFKLGR